MKKMKKIFALLIAMVMVLGMSTAVFAATGTDSGQGGSATITVNLPENRTGDNTYVVYKVFDATYSTSGISYSLVDGKTTVPTGFILDDGGNVYLGTQSATATGADGEITATVGGNKVYITPQTTELTADQISAIADYVADADKVATVVAGKDETSFTVTGLEYGYYYITTTTGSVVTVDSTNPNAQVNDKNTLSKVGKSAGTEYDADSLKAIAQVGTNQDFTAQITVGNGATKLVFSDAMTNMTYVADSLVVKKGETTLNAGTDYTLSVAEGNGGFTVTFLNVSTAFAANDVITLTYKGLVTSDALSANPATNKATITTDNNMTSESDEVEVYNAKFTVTKKDGAGEALSGAGFVIQNADDAYYCLAADKKSITWYTLAENETLAQAIAAGKVTEYTSNSSGAVTAFTGLKDGTYTLVESTTPAGYNTAADYDFTISGGNYEASNLEQATTVVNESGAELPSTGGIGTTIFYIVGAILVIGAGVVLVTRRRMNVQ